MNLGNTVKTTVTSIEAIDILSRSRELIAFGVEKGILRYPPRTQFRKDGTPDPMTGQRSADEQRHDAVKRNEEDDIYPD
jgi:hypothetical protein